jgi:hypothetical protein
LDDCLDPEWQEWYALTPIERWRETGKLWAFYLSVGGSLDPEERFRKSFRRSGAQQVRYLLMGGQACVLYGAAEFSRDCDIAILCEPTDLGRLQGALDELQARTIVVPPFEADYLLRGHAVHFRCEAPGVENIRLDVMSSMRGAAPFDELWQHNARSNFTIIFGRRSPSRASL